MATSKRQKQRRDIHRAIFKELKRQEAEGYPSEIVDQTIHPTVHLMDHHGKQVCALAGGFDLLALAEAVLQATETTEA